MDMCDPRYMEIRRQAHTLAGELISNRHRYEIALSVLYHMADVARSGLPPDRAEAMLEKARAEIAHYVENERAGH